MTRVIVLHEKHGMRYRDASTDELWARSALDELTERWREGWYTDPAKLLAEHERWSGPSLQQLLGDAYTDNVEQLKLALGDYRTVTIDTFQISDPDVVTTRLKKLTAAINRWKELREYRAWYEETRRVVQERDLSFKEHLRRDSTVAWRKPVAWLQLEARADHEYENVSLEDAS